jgi:aldose 1-epimerase
MSGASYEIDGNRVHLQANAHNGTAIFNGGERGWGRTTWDVAVHIENSITFVLFDRMWNGFPGIFAACLTHTVTPYEWRVAFGVTPLIKPSPLDLSQTVFFNLDGFKSDVTNTVLNHALHLPNAGMRFEEDDLGVPTGNILSNRREREYDFWSSNNRAIGDGLKQKPELPAHCRTHGGRDCGYDDTFLLSHEDAGRKEERPSAILSSSGSGITMQLFTDRDALHVHTWNERDGK